MVAGFLGTLIGLERAIGTGKRWAYAAPALTAIGALILLLRLDGWLGPLLITLGSGVLVAVLATLVRLQPALFTVVIALGGVVWLVGNALWLLGQSVPQVVLWWSGFFILTIVGERLELSRILRLSHTAKLVFGVSVAFFCIGLLVAVGDNALGARIVGVSMAALAVWLLIYDIARRRIKAGGQARFIALSLISGYVWLGVGGLLTALYAGVLSGLRYDAQIHAVLVGFVFTMIFAHALIVFPAVLQRPLAYHPRFYSHVIVLQIGLLMRVSGDLALNIAWRRWGSLVSAIAVIIFLVNTATALRDRGDSAI